MTASVRTHVLVLAAAVAVGSCGGSIPRSHYEHRDRRANEILALDIKIMDYRKELGLDPRPAPFLIQQAQRSKVMVTPAATPQSDSERCLDVCELSEYICKAAEDICRLSDELGEDDWAESKCSSAKASCKEARKRCTDCT